jgi:hypothetical protein
MARGASPYGFPCDRIEQEVSAVPSSSGHV